MVVGGHVWVCGLITAGVCVEVRGSYFQRACDCLVSRPTPGTMMLLLARSVSMSAAYVTTGAHANHVCRCEGSAVLPMFLVDPELSAFPMGMGDLTLLLV